MLNTVEAIANRIKGTVLEGKTILPVAIPGSDDHAFAIAVDPASDMVAWHLMRSQVEHTGRYPVLVCSWLSQASSWEQEVIANDFFSRFYYREERFQGREHDPSPQAVLARVAQVDLASFLENPPTVWEDALDAEIDTALVETTRRFGQAPSPSAIQALVQTGVVTSRRTLEQWLFDWELEHFGWEQAIALVDTSYLDWYEPDEPKMLLLLPTRNCWDVLAYLHWYGSGAMGSEVTIHLLHNWHHQYGAELICHYGTMLQLLVRNPPTTAATAFNLAWEQYALAPYTLQAPGVSLRDHARALHCRDRWFLHERP